MTLIIIALAYIIGLVSGVMLTAIAVAGRNN